MNSTLKDMLAQVMEDGIDQMLDPDEAVDMDKRRRGIFIAFLAAAELYDDASETAATIQGMLRRKMEGIAPLEAARAIHVMGETLTWIVTYAAETGTDLGGFSFGGAPDA